MPPQNPVGPQEGNKPSADKAEEKKESIDLDKILLPKKDAHAPETAQRVNAGVLLEQEEHATLNPEQGGEKPKPFPIQLPVEAPKKKEGVESLQTYQGDIERLVQNKNIGVVQIAAAEAVKREEPEVVEAAPQEEKTGIGKNVMMILLGVVLLAVGGAGIAYVFLRPGPIDQVLGNPQAPFIKVDATQIVFLTPEDRTRAAVMGKLENARQATALSLGLIGRLYPAAPPTSAESAPVLTNLQTILTTLSSNIGGEFVRSIDPYYYTLAVHSFDENQSLLIFKVDSYGSAYAGMLAWERSMYNDLLPLFHRTPRPRIIGEEPSTTTPPIQVLGTSFVDRVVENRDSRVMQNEAGDILLLWTFLDRFTVAITTNEHTLREIITRFDDITIVPEL